MATIKVACPKCGQKVSGDENFFGSVVECPICSASIQFPGEKREVVPPRAGEPVPPAGEEDSESNQDLPVATFETPSSDSVPDAVSPQAGSESVAAGGEKIQAESPQEEDYEEEQVVPSPVFGAISMVMALLGVVTCVFGILFAPIAIICGHVAQAKARRSPVQPAPGQTLGAIGMMIGYVWLVIAILILALAVLFKQPIAEFLESRNA